MKLAIKKPKGVFWKTDLNHEDIHQMLEAGNITEEWLICGQGEAKDAVLISEFLENPSKLKPCQNPQKDAKLVTVRSRAGVRSLLCSRYHRCVWW